MQMRICSWPLVLGAAILASAFVPRLIFVTASSGGFARVLERKVCARACACLSTRVMNAYVLPGHLCRM